MAEAITAKTIVNTEVSMLELSIHGNWYMNDFVFTMLFIERSFAILNNARNIIENKNQLQKLYKWSQMKLRNPQYLSSSTYFEKSTLNGINNVKNSTIKDIKLNIEAFENLLLNIKLFIELDLEIENLLFKDFYTLSYRVIKIKYSSPGEIITEIPKAIAGQGNDLLNTILYYSKRKKQLELENQINEIKLDQTKQDAQNRNRLNALHSVNEDLIQAVTVIKNLAELKNALKDIGATDEEATQFVKKWLLDRLDIVFPLADKISNINLLEK